MRDEDIDFSDLPELTDEMLRNAVRWPGPKKQVTVRLDPDVLAFFKKKSRRYQTAINAVLRHVMETQQKKRAS